MTQTALGKRVGLDQKTNLPDGKTAIPISGWPSLFRLLSALDVGMALEPKAIEGTTPVQGNQENNKDEW